MLTGLLVLLEAVLCQKQNLMNEMGILSWFMISEKSSRAEFCVCMDTVIV